MNPNHPSATNPPGRNADRTSAGMVQEATRDSDSGAPRDASQSACCCDSDGPRGTDSTVDREPSGRPNPRSQTSDCQNLPAASHLFPQDAVPPDQPGPLIPFLRPRYGTHDVRYVVEAGDAPKKEGPGVLLLDAGPCGRSVSARPTPVFSGRLVATVCLFTRSVTSQHGEVPRNSGTVSISG